MRLADARRAEEDDVLLTLQEAELVSLALIEGWKLKSKSSRVLMAGSRLERMAA